MVGLLERDRERDAWWRYWAPTPTRRCYRLVLAVQFFLSAILAWIATLVFGDSDASLVTRIGKGAAYGLAVQALLHYDVGALAGPLKTPASLARLSLGAAYKWLEAEAERELQKDAASFSDEGLIRFVYSLTAKSYPLDLVRASKPEARLAHEQIAAWASVLTGKPGYDPDPTSDAYVPPTAGDARALLEREAVSLSKETRLLPPISLEELKRSLA